METCPLFAAHCPTCTTDDVWKRSAMDAMQWDGICPHGYTADDHPVPTPRSASSSEITDEEAQDMLDNLRFLVDSGGGCADTKRQRAELIKKLEARLR